MMSLARNVWRRRKMTNKSPTKKHKHPNASCMVDAVEFIIWSIPLTHEEVGKIFNQINLDLLGGDFKEVEKYPFIIKTFKGHQKRKSIPPYIRRKILSAGYCAFCKSKNNLTVDHIKPVVWGGSDDIKNLQCLCWSCNLKKGPRRNGKTSSNSILSR